MAPEDSPPSPAMRKFCVLLFVLLLAGFSAMILRLPVFPSQDGPMHVYHAHVYGSLLRGGGPYEEYFRITQYFPPYSFFNYAFLALNTVFEALWAEKLLVCGYVVWFCWSFRYLVHSVQPANFVAPLFAFPLVMHRLAFMGFYNFIYGAATALFLVGFWIRYHSTMFGWRSAGFALCLAALTLTHPLGVVTVLGFVCLHLATGLVMAILHSAGSWMTRLASALRQHRGQLMHLAMFPFALGWIAMFSYPTQLGQPSSGGSRESAYRLLALVGAWVISPLQTLGYRALLLTAVALILLLAYRSLDNLGPQRRNALPLLLMGSGYLAAYFIVAPDIFFADRFPALALPFLAAFAGARSLYGKPGVVVAVILTVLSSALLVEQARLTGTLANEIKPLLSSPVSPRMRVALTADSPYESTPDLMYSPYFWAGTHIARRSDGVVVNAAWLSPKSPIMTFTTRQPRPWENKGPYQMTEYLLDRTSLLPPTDALVIWKTGFANTEKRLPTILGTHRTVLAGPNLALYVK